MMLEVFERMRHVRLAREKRLLPDRVAVTNDAARAAHAVGKGAEEKFRTERGLPQLGVGEPEIVHPLDHMVRKFVPERESQAYGVSLFVDQIDAGDLRLLAA